MPKYSITIADIDLNIHTDESPEMVETLVRTVDESFRSIAAMSQRLSKSETAVLCAVDYCAAKIRSETRTKELEEELARVSEALARLREEYDTLSSQADEIRRENRVMNDLISKNLGAAAAAATKAPAPAPQGEQLSILTDEAPADTPIPATEVMFDTDDGEDDDDGEGAVLTPTPEEEPKKKPRRTPRARGGSSPRNKVGDMFDMLTFKDV